MSKIIIIIAIVSILIIVTPQLVKGETKMPIKEMIINTARRLNLKPSIALAIAKIESSFNPNAINPSDPSYGLFQTTIPTASAYAGRVVSKEDLLNADTSAYIGCLFLKDLVSKYELERAVQSYNLGETRYNRGLRAPEYLAKFLKAQKEFLIYD